MPLDAGMIRCLAHELNRTLTGAKVERIQQPEKEELLLQLHQNRAACRLLGKEAVIEEYNVALIAAKADEDSDSDSTVIV